MERVGGKAIERFWAKVDRRGPDECWPWTGEIKANGYGRFTVWTPERRHHYAHRVAFTEAHGSIPDGHDVDHQCHNVDDACAGGDTCIHRRCCNPSHLRAATRKVNLAAGRQPVRARPKPTHCKWGHPFDEENTWVMKTGGWHCRACNNRRQKMTQQRKRERSSR